MEKSGYSLLLPTGMLEYFEITDLHEEDKSVDIYLREFNTFRRNIRMTSLSPKDSTKRSPLVIFPYEGGNYFYISRGVNGLMRALEI